MTCPSDQIFSVIGENLFSRLPTRFDIIWAVKPQKMARALKFRK